MKNVRNAMNHFDLWTRIQIDSNSSLAVLIQILAIPPITTATNKRLFSALKFLKTFLRNTMKEVV